MRSKAQNPHKFPLNPVALLSGSAGLCILQMQNSCRLQLQILLRPASRDLALLRSAWEPLGTTKYGSCTVLHLARTISSTRKRAVRLDGKVVIMEPCSGSRAAVETQAPKGPMGILSYNCDPIWFVYRICDDSQFTWDWVIVLLERGVVGNWITVYVLFLFPRRGRKSSWLNSYLEDYVHYLPNLTKYSQWYNCKKYLLRIQIFPLTALSCIRSTFMLINVI